jgi:hypothetical protein
MTAAVSSGVDLNELPCASWIRWNFEDFGDFHHCRRCLQNLVDGIPHTYPAREILPRSMARNFSRCKKSFNLVRQFRRVTPQINRVTSSDFHASNQDRSCGATDGKCFELTERTAHFSDSCCIINGHHRRLSPLQRLQRHSQRSAEASNSTYFHSSLILPVMKL